ncbi:hypothetical protein ACLH1L_02445, partial [Klebsiella sp. 1SOBk11mer]|uniref:hypothetical protein n=1 Tax=Klebsiella sp. 1SOBk11mer TaxID=3391009 RepID=UPI003982E078
HHAFSSGAGRTSDGNGSHASTLKSPSYTKSVSWQHYPIPLTNLKISVQKVVLFYCALAGQHQKIRNFPGINIHHFYTNDAKTVSPIR